MYLLTDNLVMSYPDTYAFHLYNYMWQKSGQPKDEFTGLYGRLQSIYNPGAKKMASTTPTPKAMVIAVITCDAEPYRQRQAMQRQTWIPLAQQAGYTVEVFDGVTLGVPDDYLSLPLKTKALCQWALGHGYQHVLKIDDDGYLNVKNFRLVEQDYAGIPAPANDLGCGRFGISAFTKGTIKFHYASGGAYWLSRRAMETILAAHLDDWAEDRWVGQVMGRAGILLKALPGYFCPVWDGHRFLPFAPYLNDRLVAMTQLQRPEDILECHNIIVKGQRPTDASAKARQHQPPVPAIVAAATPIVNANWREEVMGQKVNHALKQNFRMATAVQPGTQHHTRLAKMFPDHFEERVPVGNATWVLFLVR